MGAIGNRCPRCLLELSLREADPEENGDSQPPSQSAAIGSLLGQRFGPYELLAELGHGGMGVIYRARQVELNRVVALKMIRSVGLCGNDFLQRFHTEARAAAALEHPNIVAIHEVGECEGLNYFTMRLIEGPNLAQEVKHKGPLEGRRAAELILKIARAVEYAHRRGVLHRDLKPANILLDAAGEPYVTDFGLAKLREQDSGLTLSQAVLGTPNYMAPEQAAGRSKEVTTAADVYSLGAILFEILTGKRPFGDETPMATLRRVMEESVPAPRSLNGSIPKDLETICLKCLSKEPERRYSSAEALAEDLERWLANEPIQARRVSLWEQGVLWCRRKPVIAALGIGLVLCGIALAVGAPVALIRIQRERALALRNAAEEKRQRQTAEAAVYRLELQQAEELFASCRAADGLAVLASLLRQKPDDDTVAERLLHELTHRSFALPVVAPLPHPDRVFFAQFSADGRRLLTASRDCTTRLWDTANGHPLASPLVHDRRLVRSDQFVWSGNPMWATFSPDGRQVATASLDGKAAIWDSATGQQVSVLMQHPDWVTFVRYSPDGRWLATGCRDGRVRYWDAATGQSVGPVLQHSNEVNTIEFDADGRWLLTSSDDGTAQVWEVASGQRVGNPLRHGRAVRGAAFSRDANRVVTGSSDYTARIWDARTSQPLTPDLRHEGIINSVEFSPDGRCVVTTSFDHTARVWDSQTGRPVYPPLVHKGRVRGASFSPDGYRLVTASEDRTARVWDARTGLPLTEPLWHAGAVWHACFSPDGCRVVTSSSDRTAQIWDVRPGQARPLRFRHAARLTDVEWSPRADRLLLAGAVPSVWEVLFPRRVHPGELITPGNRVAAAQFSPDARFVATAEEQGTVAFWDSHTGQLLHPPGKHGDAVLSARLSPDGRLFVTASADHTARVWNAATGTEVCPPLRHEGIVNYAEFSPDGKRLATASADCLARIWEMSTGATLTRTLGHGDEVNLARFSPDGNRVVTTTKAGLMQLWDARSGKALGGSMKHDGAILSVRFSRDGRQLLTASEDRTARLWDGIKGGQLGEPWRHDGMVRMADFSTDETRVVTACESGVVRVWGAATGQPRSGEIKPGRGFRAARFSPDGTWLGLAGEGWGYAFEFTQVSGEIPGWLPELAEAVAGQKRIGPNVFEPVSTTELLRLKEGLAWQESTNRPARWARWFFGDRLTRAVSPSAQLTIQFWIETAGYDSHGNQPGWVLDDLWEALAYRPSHPYLTRDLARVLAQQDSIMNPAALAQADWLSRRALVLEVSDAEVWWARALCLERQGDLSGALEAIHTATQLGPRNFYVWRAQAFLLERAERVPEALESLTQAIAALKSEPVFGETLVNTFEEERNQMRQRHPAPAASATNSATDPRSSCR